MLIRRNVVLGWAAPFCITALFLLGREINAFGQEKAAFSPSKPIPTEDIKALQTVAEKSNYLGTARELEVLDFLQKSPPGPCSRFACGFHAEIS